MQRWQHIRGLHGRDPPANGQQGFRIRESLLLPSNTTIDRLVQLASPRNQSLHLYLKLERRWLGLLMVSRIRLGSLARTFARNKVLAFRARGNLLFFAAHPFIPTFHRQHRISAFDGLWRTDSIKFLVAMFQRLIFSVANLGRRETGSLSFFPRNDSRLVWRQAFQEKQKMLNVRQHGADLPDADMVFPCGSRCRSPIADAMVGSRPLVHPLPTSRIPSIVRPITASSSSF
jgi:hypothetical protein